MPSFDPEPNPEDFEWPEMDAIEDMTLQLEAYHRKNKSNGTLAIEIHFSGNPSADPHYVITSTPGQIEDRSLLEERQEDLTRILKDALEKAFHQKLQPSTESASILSSNKSQATTPHKSEPFPLMGLESIKQKLKESK
jgi:hypothetical protein